MTLGRLARCQLKQDLTATAGLALAFLTALGLAIAPPLLAGLAASGSLRDTLAASSGVTISGSGWGTEAAVDAFQNQSEATVDAELGTYLETAEEYLRSGPIDPGSINGQAPAAPLHLDLGYLAHLGTHVQDLVGQIPGDGSTSLVGAASMDREDASQAGLKLGDVVCLAPGGSPGGQACARIIGLWRPLDPGSGFWKPRASGIELFMDRADFLAVLGSNPTLTIDGGTRYRPRISHFGLGQGSAVAEALERLRHDAGGFGARVDSDLGRRLEDFAAGWRQASFEITLVDTILALLGVLLVGALGRRFIDLRGAELRLLRQRGWPQRRVARLTRFELGLIGQAALVLAVLVTAPVAVATGAFGGGSGADQIRLSGLPLGILLVGCGLWILDLGRRAGAGRAKTRPYTAFLARAALGIAILGRGIRWELVRRRLETRSAPGALADLGAAGAIGATLLAAIEAAEPARLGPPLVASHLVGLGLAVAALAIILGFDAHLGLRARAEDNAALFLDGLAMRALAGFLALERRLRLTTAGAAGLALGLALALVAFGPGLSPPVMGVGTAATVAMVAVASVVSGARIRISPLDTLRGVLQEEPQAR